MEILVVGAGIAGCTAAALLGWADHRVTLVEHDPAVREGGSPVHVRGGALPIAERLGIAGLLREAETGVDRAEFVDPRGTVRATARLRTSGDDVEIGRAELNRLLLEQVHRVAQVVSGDGPRTLTELPDGIEVGFERGRPERYDLVVGADGQHSQVRRLGFGRETAYVTPTGIMIGAVPLGPEFVASPRVVRTSHTPGATTIIHPAGGHPVGVVIVREEEPDVADDPALQPSREERMAILEKRIGRRMRPWHGTDILEAVRRSPDAYLDSIGRVEMASWSRGRVVLLGDAACGLTLLGDSGSVAMTGAGRLVDALSRLDRPGDLAQALGYYERAHRPEVEHHLHGVEKATTRLLPMTRRAIRHRHRAVRFTRRV